MSERFDLLVAFYGVVAFVAAVFTWRTAPEDASTRARVWWTVLVFVLWPGVLVVATLNTFPGPGRLIESFMGSRSAREEESDVRGG